MFGRSVGGVSDSVDDRNHCAGNDILVEAHRDDRALGHGAITSSPAVVHPNVAAAGKNRAISAASGLRVVLGRCEVHDDRRVPS